MNSDRDLRFLLNIRSNYIIRYRGARDYHCVAFEKFGTPLTIFGGSGLVDVWDNSWTSCCFSLIFGQFTICTFLFTVSSCSIDSCAYFVDGLFSLWKMKHSMSLSHIWPKILRIHKTIHKNDKKFQSRKTREPQKSVFVTQYEYINHTKALEK